MLMQIKDNGFKELSELYGDMSREGKTARRNAVKDVGQIVKKALTRNRQAGAGMQPLGFISKLLGNRKPWGKKKFTVYLPRGLNPMAVVTTKGANKTMEEGGLVPLTPKFRRFLAFKGVYIRGPRNRTVYRSIPARPLFTITWNQVKGQIGEQFDERFFYQLNRALRGRLYRNGAVRA